MQRKKSLREQAKEQRRWTRTDVKVLVKVCKVWKEQHSMCRLRYMDQDGDGNFIAHCDAFDTGGAHRIVTAELALDFMPLMKDVMHRCNHHVALCDTLEDLLHVMNVRDPDLGLVKEALTVLERARNV